MKNYLKQFDVVGGLDIDVIQAQFPKYTFTPFKTYGQVFQKGGIYEHIDKSIVVEGVGIIHCREYINDCHCYLQENAVAATKR